MRMRLSSAMQRPLMVALAVHAPALAATRLRVEQYRSPLSVAGVDLVLWTFFRAQDYKHFYGQSQFRRGLVVLRALLRLPMAVLLLLRAHVVLVQREALPLGPPVLEAIARRRCPLIWDLDDAVWEPYISPTAGRVPQWLRATGDKFRWLCQNADEVWAGSEYLARWCRQHNESVRVVPTVVPVPSSPPASVPGPTVAWIGSHSTGEFLEEVLPALTAVQPAPRVRIVGADVRVPGTLEIEKRTWSLAEEQAALESARLGLYPITRSHPLADGKCGLKAILYMSHGVPPVVTPTPTNAQIVRHGVEGLHADDLSEWTDRVQQLLDDDELWAKLSRAAHARALEEFSLQAWGPRVASYVRALLDERAS